MLAAIVGALLAGLAFGPMLDAGHVTLGRWGPFVLVASSIAGVAAAFNAAKLKAVLVFGWTFLGSVLCVLILCAVAAGAVPRLSYRSSVPPPSGERASVALHSGLDLFWGSSRTLSALNMSFNVDRLDVLSRNSLRFQQRLLLAQPQLLKPEELVALDEWVRAGGRAVILADPLLIWPSDLAVGDRRRPPVTSLLDPLLTHWGLKLEPAATSAVQRRFVENNRLLVVEGASVFTVRDSSFARCNQIDDGLMVTCRVGTGKVRLIADADLLDDRLWQSAGDEILTSDTMALLDRWLRRPLSPAPVWPDATIWVRSMGDVVSGLRWAFLVAILWAASGVYLLTTLAGMQRGKDASEHK